VFHAAWLFFLWRALLQQLCQHCRA
jgi:hypothetical protein